MSKITAERRTISRRGWLSTAALVAATPTMLAMEVVRAKGADASTTESVFNHHLGAFAKGLEEIMVDYSESSVIVTPQATHAGLNEIRKFFGEFLATATPQFWAAFKVVSRSIQGDVAYLVWSSVPAIVLATDTLLVLDGKIAVQTFTPFSK